MSDSSHHHRAASMSAVEGTKSPQPVDIPAPSHPSTSNANPSFASSPPVNRPRRGSILSMFALSPLDTTSPIVDPAPTRPPGLSHSPSSSTTSTETSDSYGLASSAPAGPPATWHGSSGGNEKGPQSPLSSWLRQLHDHPEEDAFAPTSASARVNRMGARPYGPVGMGTGARRLSFGWNANGAEMDNGAAGFGQQAGSEDGGHFGLFRRLSMGSRSPQNSFRDSSALSTKDGPPALPAGLGIDEERGRALAPPQRRRSSVRKLSPMGERILRGDGGWGN